MTEKQFTVEDIEDMIYQLGVLITDASQGILITTLKKNFFEEYKKFDTITAWECFVDQVNRIQSVVELHDFLAECNKEDWKLLLERFEG
jgi:peptide methionine sulfoxide reductase MsrB